MAMGRNQLNKALRDFAVQEDPTRRHELDGVSDEVVLDANDTIPVVSDLATLAMCTGDRIAEMFFQKCSACFRPHYLRKLRRSTEKVQPPPHCRVDAVLSVSSTFSSGTTAVEDVSKGTLAEQSSTFGKPSPSAPIQPPETTSTRRRGITFGTFMSSHNQTIAVQIDRGTGSSQLARSDIQNAPQGRRRAYYSVDV